MKLKEEMGWLSVSYMRGDELLPTRHSRVYYEYKDDFSLFTATPADIDRETPDYLTVPDEYTDLDPEVRDAMRVTWNGTTTALSAGADFDELNHSTLLVSLPDVSDDLWQVHRRRETIVEAAHEGWETEQRAREIVGDAYFDAITANETDRALNMLSE